MAARLDIPYYVLDVQEEFSRRVIEPFLADYEAGRTPTPASPATTRSSSTSSCARPARSAPTALPPATTPGSRSATVRSACCAPPSPARTSPTSYTASARRSWPGPASRSARGARPTSARRRASWGSSPPTSPTASRSASSPAATTASCWRPAAPTRAARSATRTAPCLGATWASGTNRGAALGLGSLPAGDRGAAVRARPRPRLTHRHGGAPRLAAPRRPPRRRCQLHRRPAAGGRVPGRVRVRYGGDLAPATVRVEGDQAVVEPDEPLTSASPGQAAVFYDSDQVLGGGRVLRAAAVPALAG